MPWYLAFIMLATGVVLPTIDSYSDIFMTYKVYTFEPSDIDWCDRQYPGHDGDQKYVVALITPPIISWLFITFQWFRLEVGAKRKLLTLPLLLLQIYPQWRALRVLYYGKWKKKRGWQRMKEEWETEICNLGE